MATWDEVVVYLRNSFQPAEDTGELLKIFVNDRRGKARLMVVEYHTPASIPAESWATISSLVANAHCVDIHSVLKRVGERYAVGGIVRSGDSLMLRHSVPLSSTSVLQFAIPFHLVMTSAAELQDHFLPEP